MDAFERALIDRFLRGSVNGILDDCDLVRLRMDDNKSGFLNVDIVFNAVFGVRKGVFIGVFDF